MRLVLVICNVTGGWETFPANRTGLPFSINHFGVFFVCVTIKFLQIVDTYWTKFALYSFLWGFRIFHLYYLFRTVFIRVRYLKKLKIVAEFNKINTFLSLCYCFEFVFMLPQCCQITVKIFLQMTLVTTWENLYLWQFVQRISKTWDVRNFSNHWW